LPAFSINQLTLIISSLASLIVVVWGWESSGRWALLSTRAQRRLQQAETPILQEDSLLRLPAGSLERKLLEAGLS
jgi:hypothetical protein